MGYTGPPESRTIDSRGQAAERLFDALNQTQTTMQPDILAKDSQDRVVVSPVDWLTSVLREVASHRTSRFAGLGLVVYKPPMDLPVTPLVPADLSRDLPCVEMVDSVRLLRRLSDAQSPIHDGFHLIDATTMAITHVCHFFAPPIPSKLPPSIPNYAVGARFMAALLGSLLPSVVMTGILGEREGAIAIERGVIRSLKVTSTSSPTTSEHVAQ